MTNPDPRIPNTFDDAYAIGFMIGYLGDVPDIMGDVYGIYEPSLPPNCFPDTLASVWRAGYDSGVAFYSDHIGDYDD